MQQYAIGSRKQVIILKQEILLGVFNGWSSTALIDIVVNIKPDINTTITYGI